MNLASLEASSQCVRCSPAYWLQFSMFRKSGQQRVHTELSAAAESSVWVCSCEQFQQTVTEIPEEETRVNQSTLTLLKSKLCHKLSKHNFSLLTFWSLAVSLVKAFWGFVLEAVNSSAGSYLNWDTVKDSLVKFLFLCPDLHQQLNTVPQAWHHLLFCSVFALWGRLWHRACVGV